MKILTISTLSHYKPFKEHSTWEKCQENWNIPISLCGTFSWNTPWDTDDQGIQEPDWCKRIPGQHLNKSSNFKFHIPLMIISMQ